MNKRIQLQKNVLMEIPKLTVVIPVYNGEKYLSEAINSVLTQTFEDFELIIINDGSTDRSLEIIKTYNDDRIILIDNELNQGIYYCRNLGLEKARGKYLTWTDCDDINELTRFEEQIDFLNRNTEFGACGTLIKRFGGEEYISKEYQDPELVKAKLLFKPSIANATAMLRLSKIKEFNLKYNSMLPIAADYEFIFRCSLSFPITNLKKVLYRYRDSETSISRKYAPLEAKKLNIYKGIYKGILSHLKITPTDSEINIHRSIGSPKLFDSFPDYKRGYDWLKFLEHRNKLVCLYNENAFNKILADQFYFISKKTSQLGLPVFFYYLNQSYKGFGFVSLYKIVKLSIRCLIKYNRF